MTDYRVIQYSDEHIHIVTKNDNRCYKSRNWTRCDAPDHFRLRDCKRDGNNCKDRSYYDGNDWTKADKPD